MMHVLKKLRNLLNLMQEVVEQLSIDTDDEF